MKYFVGLCFLITICCPFVLPTNAQQTERAPFALELPELNTGQIAAPKSYVARTDVNLIKFWVLNPAADSIDWSKIKIRINRQAANIACSQNAASNGKVLRCDLNRIAGFRLQLKENLFEIEAESRDLKRFYASFVVITDINAATRQISEKAGTENDRSGGSSSSVTRISNDKLGFSGRKFAVVIGISQYQYNDIGLGNLNFADKDAETLYSWMTQSGGFSPGDVLFMTNKNATLSAVRDSLNRFLTKATENDLVLFFLAGHGTPDPFNPRELYYLVYDSKVADLKNTGFPMTELKQIIDAKLKSKRAIFLLDTCHSAGITGKKIVVARASAKPGNRDLSAEDGAERKLEREVEIKNDVNQAAARLFGSTGRAILTSSDVNESSRESERWGGGHGVFTWALLDGLRGNADLNIDKSITANELFNYISQKVRAETKDRQNPRLFSSLKSDLEITSVK